MNSSIDKYSRNRKKFRKSLEKIIPLLYEDYYSGNTVTGYLIFDLADIISVSFDALYTNRDVNINKKHINDLYGKCNLLHDFTATDESIEEKIIKNDKIEKIKKEIQKNFVAMIN